MEQNLFPVLRTPEHYSRAFQNIASKSYEGIQSQNNIIILGGSHFFSKFTLGKTTDLVPETHIYNCKPAKK